MRRLALSKSLPRVPDNPLAGHDVLRSRLRKVAFESLYGPFAWAYDWVSRTFFLGQWRRWQRAAIPHLRGPGVLEIGMGTGDLHLDLLRKGFRAWGVDFSPQMLRQARRKARRAGQPVNLCRARAQALPFPGGAFNSVVSTFPSEYIIDPRTVGEIARVLAPGGRLVVVPGGWIERRGARGKLVRGVARLVYGSDGTGRRAEERARRAQGVESGRRWLSALRSGIAGEHFELSTYVVSSEQGACLVVVADKR
jgi:ubiquinone/menaquinone biosynthesis C-methylase UbiE